MKKNSNIFPIIKNTNFLMTLVMLLIGLANIFWAEKLEINQGFGWDGMNYAAWARDFHRTILVERVPDYYVKRILPSALVHYGSRLVTAPFFPEARREVILNEARNIVLSFDLYNLLLLLVAVSTWGLIANELKIQDRGKWFGFCFLFLNYAILKNNFYHSILTDTSAFTLGLLMFYFFLTNKPIGLWITIFLGGFTWPSIPYMGALLFVFPYQKAPDTLAVPVTRSNRQWPLLVTLIVCGLALIMFAYLRLNLAHLLSEMSRMLRVDRTPLYLSMAAVLAYLFFGLKPAVSDSRLFDPRSIFKAIRWSRVGIIVLTFFLLQVLFHRLASGEELTGGWGGQWRLLEYIFLSALTEPFIFLVAHTLYYGPVFLLLVFFWKPFCQSIQEYGIGLRLFVLLNLFLSIAPQSRYQINAIAVFVILLVKLLDRSFLKTQSFAFWVLLTLLYSKVWYTFNTAPQVDDGTIDILLRFPLQHYFTNSGPWMAPQMYLIQGSIVLVTAILLYLIVIRRTVGATIPPQPEQTSS